MPPAKNFLQSLLHSSRASLVSAINTKPCPPTAIVIGNESADLDSLASSLLYAALSPSRPTPIPFLQIPRADLSLRPEFLHLLKELSLSTSDLLCIDDSPSFTSLPADALEIHLVDHNKLTLPLPEDRVRGVIDHHDDEGAYPNASPRVVEKAGSCASLVVETFFDASRLDGGDPEAKGQIARLALAAVLMDTANLTHKVTPHDTAAVELLRRECLPPSWDQNAFYAALFKAKTSVDGLSLRDLLRKDYKEWTEAGRKIGIACVVKGVDWLRTKGDLEEALKSWGRERGLDIVGVMTTQGQGSEFRRELLLWALNPEVRDAVKCFERRAQEIGLGLETWKGGELDVGEERKAWEQRNLAMSRKQISPLLRECLKETAGCKSKV